jgi:hypothetical protein
MIDVNAIYRSPASTKSVDRLRRQYRGTGLRNRENVAKLQILQHAHWLKVNKKAGASAGLF